MSSRDSRLRRRRAQEASLRDLATEFGISVTRVRQILEDTGGDPLAPRYADVVWLEAERDRLRERIAADRRRLRDVLDELESRRTDQILRVG